MKILIVGPANEFGNCFEDFKRHGASIVAWAMCLDQALESLQCYDGVVCAQCFPTHMGRASEPIETMSGNWAALSNACQERGVPFLLITRMGNYDLCAKFNKKAPGLIGTWSSFAFVAPVDMDLVARTICLAALYPAPIRAIEPQDCSAGVPTGGAGEDTLATKSA